MNGSILVPLDGSLLAEQALPYAVSLAQHTNNSLFLLRSVDQPRSSIPLAPGTTLTVDEQLEIIQDDARTYLQHVVETLGDIDVAVATTVVVGAPVENIVETAEEREVACVVMATHGRGGIVRWALGSVTDRVLRLSSRPLLIIRPHISQERDVEPPPDIRRILTPLDDSRLAEQALEYAIPLATAYDAELFLFRAISMPAAILSATADVKSTYRESARQRVEEYLARMAASARTEGITVEYVLGTAPVAEALLSFVKVHEIDLVVMTTHAREGLDRLILGSVTDRIVRAGDVPVFVTHPSIEGSG